MFINNNTCPFIQSSSCNKNCLFFHNQKNQCVFRDCDYYTTEYKNDTRNSWKYNENSVPHESEFYIWNNERNTYDLIKWEYTCDILDL